jgi:hypothetical protein
VEPDAVAVVDHDDGPAGRSENAAELAEHARRAADVVQHALAVDVIDGAVLERQPSTALGDLDELDP